MTLIAVLVDAHCAPAQSVSTTRPPLGLDVSLPAAKRMAGAREFIAAGDWDAAIRALDVLTREFGESLIEVEPGRYINVRLAVASTYARLPPDGLAAYRRRIDPVQQAVYQEAAEHRDAELMRQIVADGFASSVGDDALDWLGESAMQHGRIDAARDFWTAMLPPPATGQPAAPGVLRYPDATRFPAEVCARLVLCSVLQGADERARGELATFATRFGDAAGTIAGRDGPLAQTLAALIEESGQWRAGGAPSESGRTDVPKAPRLEGVLWSRGLPGQAPAHGATPDIRPAIWRDALLLNSPAGVWALAASTGRSQWPAGAQDAGLLDAAVSDDLSMTVGVPRFDGQIVDGRWFGRRGSLISVAALRQASPPPSQIACFDLNAEGRLEWSINSVGFAELAGARFSGPPLVCDGRLLVTVRRATPQIEIALACFDAGNGDLRWVQPLCASLESQPVVRHRIHHDVLAAGGDLVFQCPGAGVIAARHADNGELRWAVTYDVLTGLSNDDSPSLRPTALTYHGGRLFVKPADSDQVIALSAVDGRTLWSARPPSRIDAFLGVDAERVIACGTHLWGFAVASGRPWRFGFDDPEGFGFGRGALAAGRVYWTTRGDLFVVDSASGRALDRVDLAGEIGLSGGNLSVSDDALMIATPSRLTALGPRSKN